MSTDTQLAEFAKGDQVTDQDGTKYVVINQGSPGSAVHVETAQVVEPYNNTFVAADSLKKGSSRNKPKKDEPKGDNYNVVLKVGDDTIEHVMFAGDAEGATQLALDAATNAGHKDIEVVRVEKAAK